LTRVAVILHERLGNWNRQLRPRLAALPVRWFETRSQSDLDAAVIGRASPLVLVDLARQPVRAVIAVDQLLRRASDARVLVLDPEGRKAEAALARELGATHVISGFVPPPVVADLLARWIALAERDIKRSGWSQTSFPESQSDSWGWLDEFLTDAEDNI
jgi:hypothetical protein